MKVELRLGGLISINGRNIALGQTFALLDAIAQERSVRGAADRLGLSYRATWGRALALEEAMGRSLIVKTKGHGTALTKLGADLLEALGATLHRFQADLGAEERVLEQRLAILAETRPSKLRIAASHDPLLMAVLAEQPDIEVTVAGSTEAVERLLAGQADAAGFHCGTVGPAQQVPFVTLLHNPAFEVRPLFLREQGLMLAPGNPLSIASIRDIADRGARFVNRQRGSGTRSWFDRLLAEADLSPRAIPGYESEEFTHQAVAAVIASGAADAGMGVRAVAERFGLAFCPVGQETYFLAAAGHADSSPWDQVIAAVDARVERTVGYARPGS